MVVSGHSLSLFGRSAISTPGGSRASHRPRLDPVEPSDPLKDPLSTEYRELQDLQERDREVRQRGQAHIVAGGRYVSGGAGYRYETGADGRRYTVGGEVSIDTAAVPDDPGATIRKKQVIRGAATAPAEPSAQDRAVAAAAARAEAKAGFGLHERQAVEGGADNPAGERVRDALDAYRDAAAGHGGRLRAAIHLTA